MRRRIRGVRSTAQITRAMQMVAASRMRRAQQRAVESRPYADAIQRMVAELGQQRGDSWDVHPLQRVRPEGRVGYAVFTSDRGLCGPLNSNVLRRATTEILAQAEDPEIVTVGRKGQDFFARRGRRLAAAFTGLGERAAYDEILPLARLLMQDYQEETVDAVYLVYPQFVNTLTQRTTVHRLLPVSSLAGEATTLEFIIEPSAEVILNALLPRYVEVEVYHALLETVASEHSARMIAMRNATENAQELIQDLNLTYNKARQAAITREIIEISSGAEAMVRAG